MYTSDLLSAFNLLLVSSNNNKYTLCYFTNSNSLYIIRFIYDDNSIFILNETYLYDNLNAFTLYDSQYTTTQSGNAYNIRFKYDVNGIYDIPLEPSSGPTYTVDYLNKYTVGYDTGHIKEWWETYQWNNTNYYGGYVWHNFYYIGGKWVGIGYSPTSSSRYGLYLFFLDNDFNVLSYYSLGLYNYYGYLWGTATTLSYENGIPYLYLAYETYDNTKGLEIRKYSIDININSYSQIWSYRDDNIHAYTISDFVLIKRLNSIVLVGNFHQIDTDDYYLGMREFTFDGSFSDIFIIKDDPYSYFSASIYQGNLYITYAPVVNITSTLTDPLLKVTKVKLNSFNNYTIDFDNYVNNYNFNYILDTYLSQYSLHVVEYENDNIIDGKQLFLVSYYNDYDSATNRHISYDLLLIDLSTLNVSIIDHGDEPNYYINRYYRHALLTSKKVNNKYIVSFFPTSYSKDLYYYILDENGNIETKYILQGQLGNYIDYYHKLFSIRPYYNTSLGILVETRYFDNGEFNNDGNIFRNIYLNKHPQVIFNLNLSSSNSNKFSIGYLYELINRFTLYDTLFYSNSNGVYNIVIVTDIYNSIYSIDNLYTITKLAYYNLSDKWLTDSISNFTLTGNLFTTLLCKYDLSILYDDIDVTPDQHLGVSSTYALKPAGIIFNKFLSDNKLLSASYSISLNSFRTGLNLSYTDILDFDAIAHNNKINIFNTEYHSHSGSFGIGNKTCSYIFLDKMSYKVMELYPNKKEHDNKMDMDIIKPIEYKNLTDVKKILFDYLSKSSVSYIVIGPINIKSRWKGDIPAQRIMDFIGNMSKVGNFWYYIKDGKLYLVDKLNALSTGYSVSKITGSFNYRFDTTIYNHFYVVHAPDGIRGRYATEYWSCQDQPGQPCLNRYTIKLKYKAADCPKLRKLNYSNSFIDQHTIDCSVTTPDGIYFSSSAGPYSAEDLNLNQESSATYHDRLPSPVGYWDTVYFTVKRANNMVLPPYDWVIEAVYPIYTEDSPELLDLERIKNYELKIQKSIDIYGEKPYPISIETPFLTNVDDLDRYVQFLAKMYAFPRMYLSFTTHYQMFGVNSILQLIYDLLPGKTMYLYNVGKFLINAVSYDLISGMVSVSGIKFYND